MKVMQTLVHGVIVDLDIAQSATGFLVVYEGRTVAIATTYSEAKQKLVEYAVNVLGIAEPVTA